MVRNTHRCRWWVQKITRVFDFIFEYLSIRLHQRYTFKVRSTFPPILEAPLEVSLRKALKYFNDTVLILFMISERFLLKVLLIFRQRRKPDGAVFDRNGDQVIITVLFMAQRY